MSWQHPNNMVFFHVLNLSSINQSFTFFSFPNKLTNVTNFFTEILTSQQATRFLGVESVLECILAT